MASTIKLKNGSGAPLAGDLVQAEPALDLTNKRLYTEDSLGNVIEVGINPSSLTIGGTALTATAAELNTLDGITATTAELNTLDGITATVTELNYTDGVTSNIQTQLNTKAPIASPTFTGTVTAPAVNVNGTVTADGLNLANATYVTLTDSASASPRVLGMNASNNTFVGPVDPYAGGGMIYGVSANVSSQVFYTAADQRLRIENNGDISFYEDTGTTAKFFWDASAERLGLGTTSPQEELHIAAGIPQIRLEDTADAIGSGNLVATIDGYGTDGRAWRIGRTFGETTLQINNDANSSTVFTTNATERMRIDSSGNLLVGTTSTLGTSAGVKALSDGLLRAVRDNATPFAPSRLTSDGAIIDLQKDGTSVGSIGTQAGYLTIGQAGASDAFLSFTGVSQPAIRPASSTSVNSDNTTDLGSSSARFKNVYATNATIQTSDGNEKQDIEALSEAEQRVAVACKGLLRKFRWKDSVAEKGDDARIHFGIIAQDLQDAFTAEGLDAGRYAMFIHSTWTDEETGEERSRMGVRYSELLAFIIAAI